MIEIHSACLNDIHLLNAIKSSLGRNLTVFLGIGGCTLDEIERTVNTLNNPNIVLMFGFQSNPTKYEDINLLKIRKIMNLYPEFSFGYADHTSWDNPYNSLISLIVTYQGMNYLEKHVTIDYGKTRCDWTSAISIEMFDNLADSIAIIDKIRGNGNLELNHAEKNYAVNGPMKKTAMTSKHVMKGETIKETNICFRRTQKITDLSQIEVLDSFGKTFSTDLNSNMVLFKSQITENFK